MKKVLFFAAVILLFAKCGKRKQYSHWKVNGNEYRSNNIEKTVGQGSGGYLSCMDQEARFSLYFDCTCLPVGGDYQIVKDVNSTPGLVEVKICFSSRCYIVSEHEKKMLSSSYQNEKSRYEMPPTWFVNFNNPTDSILVEGTFNEP